MRTHRVGRGTALVALTCTLLPGGARAQSGGPVAEAVAGRDYRIYDATGRETGLEAIVARALASEVLLIGEEHDDSIGHVLELELLERVADGSGRPVVLSLEMFERDVQDVLDEYLAGLITEEHFLLSARPWDHYRSRYRPLVEAARARGLPVVAANAPRRYVNRVTREGAASLEALPDRARRHLPPLPYPGPSERYRAEWDSIMAEAMRATEQGDRRPAVEGTPPAAGGVPPAAGGTPPAAGGTPPATGDAPPAAGGTPPAARGPPPGAPPAGRSGPPGGQEAPPERPHYAVSPNAIQAQALWDAAMGHAVATALMTHLGAVVVHVAGSFHVARGTGIPERIADYRPATGVVTVVMARSEDVAVWEAGRHAGLADFVILTRR